MIFTVAVSFIMKRLAPTKLRNSIFTLPESDSLTKSNDGDQIKSSSHFFTGVKFFNGVLAKKVMLSMGKLPFSHCTLKETVSPSSTTRVELTEGLTFEGMISVL